MKTLKYIVIGFAFALLTSCTDIIEIDLPESDPKLVVEAWLKNDSTTQYIRLSRTSSYGDDVNSSPELNATVYLETSGGTKYTAIETDTGYYKLDSTNFILHVDTIYTLNIITSDGSIYKSQEEKVESVPKIDALIFLSHAAMTEINFGYFLPDSSYYASYTTVEKLGLGDKYVWKLYQNGEDLSVGNSLFARDDALLEDGVRIPFNTLLFPDSLALGDTVKLEQMVVTDVAYDYFLQLQSQVNGGSPFSTPPAPVLGNMYNVADKNERVLGIFIVSSVHTVEQIVSEENVVNSFSEVPVF